MRLPSYPKYKPSGVEWLGDIPQAWIVKPLRFLIAQPITDGPHVTPEFVGEGVPFLSVDGIQDGELVFTNTRFVSEEDHRSFIRKAQPLRDDILMGKAASTGKIARVKVDFEFSIWSPLALIRTNCRVADSRFTEYSLKSKCAQSQVDVLCTHNTQSNISMDDIPRIVFTIPVELPEQRAIADFLDRETAKIDTLVAKKRTLIERLKEKRTALISRTVTRGLPPEVARAAGFDPHPKLKPSSIEWLGDIPEHWTLPPLYMRYKVDLGKMLNETAISGDHLVPYLRNVDVQWDQINVSDLPEMDIGPWELARYTVRRGDLLVCEGGEVGRAALVRDAADGLGYQKALHRLRPLTVVEDPRFMFFTLRWGADQGVFAAGGNPNTIPHLTGEKLRAYRLPAPPQHEQVVIADFLDRETARIDGMAAKVEIASERLQEYRTALITAAVTGKIDVQGAVA
jgi:type I restriction enzyme, S subunit